jgi:hypothetical protein
MGVRCFQMDEKPTGELILALCFAVLMYCIVGAFLFP